jgi:hypothetical protein
MVGVHSDASDSRGLGINQFPGFAGICAAPKISGTGVDYFRVLRIEGKEANHVSQVEHAPAVTAVMRDIGAGHVARYQYRICVVRADCRMKHGAATTWADNGESAWALGTEGGSCQCQSKDDGCDLHHLILSFTFDIFRLHFATTGLDLSIENLLDVAAELI